MWPFTMGYGVKLYSILYLEEVFWAYIPLLLGYFQVGYAIVHYHWKRTYLAQEPRYEPVPIYLLGPYLNATYSLALCVKPGKSSKERNLCNTVVFQVVCNESGVRGSLWYPAGKAEVSPHYSSIRNRFRELTLEEFPYPL